MLCAYWLCVVKHIGLYYLHVDYVLFKLIVCCVQINYMLSILVICVQTEYVPTYLLSAVHILVVCMLFVMSKLTDGIWMLSVCCVHVCQMLYEC